ncbi:MAG: mechanosensitive ion channel protein MscS [Denitrovibrio sp.]|nr:MAG: mechanosensitive ion channel protein MscS [Denitrovibrio sp.]
MEKIQTYLTDWISTYGMDIIYAILIFIVGRTIAKSLSKIAVKAMEKANVSTTLTKFLSGIIYYLLLEAVIIASLNQLGIETTSIVAVLATAGLAIGLALKDSLSNFAAGVMIILFKPFVIGDFVETAGTAGIVEEIGIFTVKMRTPDNKQIIAPNSSVIGGNITNYSTKPTRRVDITVGVGYDADIKQTKNVLTGVIASNGKILNDPAPLVAVSELGDSSVNFVTRSWVNAADYWDVYFELMENYKIKLDEAGINIPYPQMDVHLKKED